MDATIFLLVDILGFFQFGAVLHKAVMNILLCIFVNINVYNFNMLEQHNECVILALAFLRLALYQVFFLDFITVIINIFL